MSRVRVMLLALLLVPFDGTAHAQSREFAIYSRPAGTNQLARRFEDAIEQADLPLAIRLLSNGLDANYQFPDQQTLLHRAARDGRLEFIDLLLERGADARIMDAQDRTPADVAMESGHRDVAYMLVRIEDGGRNRSTAREDAERAIHLASTRDTRTGRDRVMQFMLAALHDDESRMRALIADGVDPNWVVGDNKLTPLLFAAMQGHAEIVELLLKRGGDPTMRDINNRNALDLARRAGHLKVVRVLRRH